MSPASAWLATGAGGIAAGGQAGLTGRPSPGGPHRGCRHFPPDGAPRNPGVKPGLRLLAANLAYGYFLRERERDRDRDRQTDREAGSKQTDRQT